MSQEAQGIIITGGARRVGEHLSLFLAKRGYDIALHYHSSQERANALRDEIESLGRRCLLFACDLAQPGGHAGLISEINQAMPHCVGLINNASVFERATLMETDETLYDRQFDINMKAPFFLSQAFARHVGRGVIINILDTTITQSQGSHFAYLLSKKALWEFTHMAARELGPAIRVNAVAPGSMLPSSGDAENYRETLAKRLPLREHPSLDQLAEGVAWLLTQDYLTGQTLFIDGGHHVV